MNPYLPPLIIDVRVRETEAKGFHIWLPLFVLWPLLFILLGLVLTVTVIVDFVLIVAGARYHHYTRLVLAALRVLGEVKGTRVNAVTDDSRIKVRIY